MKIFVMGATGRVGEELIANLTAQGYFVYAGARKITAIQETSQIKPVFVDLHADIAELTHKLADAEAVYFVAGSRGKDLLQTDLNGAVKLMQAAEQKGIKRYIQLSSMFALQPERWSSDLTDYNIAKFFSDSWLINQTKLDYTILQPGALTEEPGTGKIAVQVTQPGANAIADVATTLSELLTATNTIGQVIIMHQGELPISQALATL